jgi:hypothetical protein
MLLRPNQPKFKKQRRFTNIIKRYFNRSSIQKGWVECYLFTKKVIPIVGKKVVALVEPGLKKATVKIPPIIEPLGPNMVLALASCGVAYYTINTPGVDALMHSSVMHESNMCSKYPDSEKCRQATAFVLKLQKEAVTSSLPVTVIKNWFPSIFGNSPPESIISKTPVANPVANPIEIPDKIKLPCQHGGVLGGFK